jgi:hypothetical protein
MQLVWMTPSLFTLLWHRAGLLFDLPMPIQPMHTVVAVALTEGLTTAQIVCAGAWMGVIFVALGVVPGLMGWLQRRIPLSVVRSLQLGLGLKVKRVPRLETEKGRCAHSDSLRED